MDNKERVEFLCRHFFARRDVVAVLAPWGKPTPATPASLEEVVTSHVTGSECLITIATKNTIGPHKQKWRVGTYCSDKNGETTWCCIDVDGGTPDDHHRPCADPNEAIRMIEGQSNLVCGYEPVTETSGSAKGWHAWFFFPKPIPVAMARKVGLGCVPAGIKLLDGKDADASKGHGIEVFPKTQVKSKVGTMLWLPWWSGAKAGGNLFVDDPPVIRVMTEEQIDKCVAAAKETKEVQAEIKKEVVENKKRVEANFDGWRREALNALPIEKVYGEWLTGERSGSGWLTCRDPNSPSGDRTPSAGVADGSGEAERGAFHTFRDNETISVFDFLMRRHAITFRQAAEMVAEHSGVTLPPVTPGAPVDMRQSILVNHRQIRDVITEAWEAIRKHNSPPCLFRRGGVLVRMINVKGRNTLETMTNGSMFGQLVRAASWKQEKGEALIDAIPIDKIPEDMLNYPSPAHVPEIDAIVQCPIYDAKGNLVRDMGFNRESGIYVEEGGDCIPPDSPTDEQVMSSIGVIWDVLHDFPFDEQGDRAAAFAMLIGPFVRRMIPGCTPIHLIEAPKPGSGKGLLADVVSLLLTGRPTPVATMAQSADEVRKRLTSLLMEGPPIIMIDNINEQFSSAEICSAITAYDWNDRLLATNKTVHLENRAQWVVTANNPSLSEEVARRSIRIRIDPKVDHPWERKNFRHPLLRQFVLENRHLIIKSILTLVQKWISVGRPMATRLLGSFEDWSMVMGGILTSCGIAGFLDNLKRLYSDSDTEGRQWRDFVATWHALKQEATVTLMDILEMINNEFLLPTVIYGQKNGARSVALERELAKMRGVKIGVFTIEGYEDAKDHRMRYHLRKDAEGDDDASLVRID